MPRRRSRKSVSPAAFVTLALLTLMVLGAGQAWLFLRSDPGRVALARWTPPGLRQIVPGAGDTRFTDFVGRILTRALAAAGVPRSRIDEGGEASRSAATHEEARSGGKAKAVTWRAELEPDASLLQANYAITRSLADAGIQVLRGREVFDDAGRPVLDLVVGLPGRPTHEILLSRSSLAPGKPAESSARLTVVIYGFGQDTSLARRFCALPVPFAVALPPDDRGPDWAMARASSREIVLHLPLEPVNYPEVNPGPGTILVSMKTSQITRLVRRDLTRAGPVIAVANHLGSLATQDMTVMSAVYRELKRERLPFLHMSPAAGAVCKPLAAELGVSYQEPQAVIDYEARTPKPTLLEKRWKELIVETKARGSTLVMIRATPLTLAWLPRALALEHLAGVNLVPLSAVLRRPPV